MDGSTVTSASRGPVAPAARPDAAKALRLASEARQRHGMPALRHDPLLARAAEGHARWMARANVTKHRGAGGTGMRERILATGYDACWGAENVASGQFSAPEVVADWMGSPGHRRNVLDANLAEAAVGVAEGPNGLLYWAMVMARPCGDAG
ncbi:CAP domain-containing protein [Jannaschia sp. W003]|uniref:CAP domain-containing protein n=1 Tax=Jannaschia sp. W003 TaxID=2867012 RepID=UPI0021A5A388|nr:CAP domain-containing protein [Jannaschia sp. W003]UWQ22757.1 CAP domain-containing protein [Jannaschia sp. W003]